MISVLRSFAISIVLMTTVCAADETRPTVGESERVYTLAPENKEIRGIAWDESDQDVPQLLVLDRSGKLFEYQLGPDDTLNLSRTLDLQAIVGSRRLSSPRGLAFAMEDSRPVLYFMDWVASGTCLWRYEIDAGTAKSVDLSLYMFRIGDREGFDLASDDGGLLISYDAAGHAPVNRRVQRGILRIKWNGAMSEQSASAEHLPDAGTAPARGLGTMRWDGADYLWGTVGNDYVYCADLQTGRGLFFFDRPQSVPEGSSCWGICFGRESLWVSENVPGAGRIHRVNVTKNLDAPHLGPRVLRHLVMAISTEPEKAHDDPGAVYHFYSRPYGNRVMPNQGIWPETEYVKDLSDIPDATIRQMTLDPAGDDASRQFLQLVQYGAPNTRSYSSSYEIDLWTNRYKRSVYPHRVNRDDQALAGTNYLADDSTLYNLSDSAAYDAFTERVRAHIKMKYGVKADMQNPYWAARNVVEYIQDNYYYPSCADRKPATVDYDRGHYDANPANLKLELSARPYDKTQIIACSGTSVMVTGAMRHLGIPARWLGTGTEQAPSRWDGNGNGLLDPEETAPCTNGHRYTQVWLGSHYGWICFDATPSKPALNDYDDPPPLQPQWRYMTRCAAGHREPKRIVFNIGSELIEPLYREFEYDARLAIDNNCGGDQRYNLQGRFEKCALWKLPRHRIQVKNLCFIEDVNVEQTEPDSEVTWQLIGPWDRIPEATVSLFLQERKGGGQWRDVARLATEIAAADLSAAVDLSKCHAQQCRVILRRDGDPETGGMSGTLDLD